MSAAQTFGKLVLPSLTTDDRPSWETYFFKVQLICTATQTELYSVCDVTSDISKIKPEFNNRVYVMLATTITAMTPLQIVMDVKQQDGRSAIIALQKHYAVTGHTITEHVQELMSMTISQSDPQTYSQRFNYLIRAISSAPDVGFDVPALFQRCIILKAMPALDSVNGFVHTQQQPAQMKESVSSLLTLITEFLKIGAAATKQPTPFALAVSSTPPVHPSRSREMCNRCKDSGYIARGHTETNCYRLNKHLAPKGWKPEKFVPRKRLTANLATSGVPLMTPADFEYFCCSSTVTPMSSTIIQAQPPSKLTRYSAKTPTKDNNVFFNTPKIDTILDTGANMSFVIDIGPNSPVDPATFRPFPKHESHPVSGISGPPVNSIGTVDLLLQLTSTTGKSVTLRIPGAAQVVPSFKKTVVADNSLLTSHNGQPTGYKINLHSDFAVIVLSPTVHIKVPRGKDKLLHFQF